MVEKWVENFPNYLRLTQARHRAFMRYCGKWCQVMVSILGVLLSIFYTFWIIFEVFEMLFESWDLLWTSLGMVLARGSIFSNVLKYAGRITCSFVSTFLDFLEVVF